MKWGLLLTVVASVSCGGPDPVLPVANTDCEPLGGLEFICGVVNPEDVVAIPYSNFVVASGYRGGAIHYISTIDYSKMQVFPTEYPRLRHDEEMYPSCPGPIDPAEGEQFSAHGLNLRSVEEGLYHLYVVHHGLRESIEIFEIDTRYQGAVSVSPVPGFSWIGCVIAPESFSLNSVSPLPDGGFVATVPFLPDAATPGAGIVEGKTTGAVWEWHLTDGWEMVPGSESSGPNGIEASRDGDWLYINVWSGAQVMRLSRGRDPIEKKVVDLGFYPDNIRWQSDGSLLTAGHGAATLSRIMECLTTMCDDMSSHVARVDPDTLAIEEIVNVPANEHFFTSTAALQVNDEIWIGSVRGERIARYPSPHE